MDEVSGLVVGGGRARAGKDGTGLVVVGRLKAEIVGGGGNDCGERELKCG